MIAARFLAYRFRDRPERIRPGLLFGSTVAIAMVLLGAVFLIEK